MNVTVFEGEVLTTPKTYRMENGVNVAFLLVRVSGVKEDRDAKMYDDTIPVKFPFHALGNNLNNFTSGTYVFVQGALQRGRYLNLQGAWEIALGISATDVNPLNKDRYLKNKEAAMKNLKGEYDNE